ncbi:hypothetical protein C8Q80DRAFT_169688 [Daedaleopsis nitida]|nr:hypothetical protein C8Q80DRAFT_169688 [Daedaleopsis nitida]
MLTYHDAHRLMCTRTHTRRRSRCPPLPSPSPASSRGLRWGSNPLGRTPIPSSGATPSPTVSTLHVRRLLRFSRVCLSVSVSSGLCLTFPPAPRRRRRRRTSRHSASGRSHTRRTPTPGRPQTHTQTHTQTPRTAEAINVEQVATRRAPSRTARVSERRRVCACVRVCRMSVRLCGWGRTLRGSTRRARAAESPWLPGRGRLRIRMRTRPRPHTHTHARARAHPYTSTRPPRGPPIAAARVPCEPTSFLDLP